MGVVNKQVEEQNGGKAVQGAFIIIRLGGTNLGIGGEREEGEGGCESFRVAGGA